MIERKRTLIEIASAQNGYFTAKQAKDAGYTDSTHPYHIKNGDWTREWRGIYRISDYPYTDSRPELTLWQLWSRDRNEKVQGVFSHETALDIYDLSDNIPAKLHITVPKSFKKGSAIPPTIELNYEDLDVGDINVKNGIRITTPLKTIVDIIARQNLTEDLIKQALLQSIERGLILRSEVRNPTITGPEWAKRQLQALLNTGKVA